MIPKPRELLIEAEVWRFGLRSSLLGKVRFESCFACDVGLGCCFWMIWLVGEGLGVGCMGKLFEDGMVKGCEACQQGNLRMFCEVDVRVDWYLVWK